jgi:single-stranded-DNA-specific exonuclease
MPDRHRGLRRVTAVAEADYASQSAWTRFITDHHEAMEALPAPPPWWTRSCRADALRLPLSGGGWGVAFKPACAMDGSQPQADMDRYGDLVAVGTISDVMPFRGEPGT